MLLVMSLAPRPDYEPPVTQRADAPPVRSTNVVLFPKSRRGRRMVWFGIALLAIAWITFAVRGVLLARNEANAGLDALDAAKAQLSPQDFLQGNGRDQLEIARAHFAKAHSYIDTPLFMPIKWMPYVGRQIDAVQGLAGGATKVLDVGIKALDDAQSIVKSTHQPQGAQRIALVRRLGDIAQVAGAALDRVSIGPGHALVGPLQDAHDRFADQLLKLKDNIGGLGAASQGFASFLTHSNYLVIAANNSEMRVGSGAFLSLGEMTTVSGHFTIGELKPAISLLPKPGSVDPASVDRDLAARWGFMQPTGDFREVAVTGRFDVVAPLALKMWKSTTGHSLDGVLVLDPVALKAMLVAVGPVTVNGVQYDEHNVLQQVFVEQYRGLTLDPTHFTQEARREQLSAIARAAITKLETGHWDTVKLVDAMRGATLGRHILAWSDRAVEERGWQGAHLDGGLPADGLMLGIQNRAGNKLDQFLPTDATFDAALAPDGSSDCTISLSIQNDTNLADHLPNYVIGPYPGTFGGAPGRYIGWVVLELPGGAFQSTVDIDGKRVTRLVAAGADGSGNRVVAALTSWDPGQHHDVTVHFRLPKGDRSVEIQPSARALNPRFGGRAAVTWHFGTETFGDGQHHTVTW